MAKVFNHTSAVCLGVEVNPKISRTDSKAVPEGNDSFPHDDYRPSRLTMGEIYRVFAQELD